jgi:hypothetical protein
MFDYGSFQTDGSYGRLNIREDRAHSGTSVCVLSNALPCQSSKLVAVADWIRSDCAGLGLSTLLFLPKIFKRNRNKYPLQADLQKNETEHARICINVVTFRGRETRDFHNSFYTKFESVNVFLVLSSIF